MIKVMKFPFKNLIKELRIRKKDRIDLTDCVALGLLTEEEHLRIKITRAENELKEFINTTSPKKSWFRKSKTP